MRDKARDNLYAGKMPKLVFHDSDGVDKTLQLGTEPVTIGRASECEVQTHDAMVSRKHARIIWDGGSYYVEDLGSSNGVFLGQDKVQRAPFRPGDTVTCGSLVMRMLPEARRSISPVASAEPARPAPVEVRPPPPRDDPAAQEWDRQQPATSAVPALAPVPNTSELQRLRGDLDREVSRREQAEQALIVAEQRVAAADDAARELLQLRRRVEQHEAELARLKQQPAASPISVEEVAEAVALFNDALAEVKASLRAGGDEAKLLKAPEQSVTVVRESLRNATDELERARGRLRDMIRKLGFGDA